MQSILCEIKKSMYFPFFLLSCLGTAFVCLLSEGFVSASGKSYMILELLLFLRKDAMLSDISLNRYDIWVQGIGTWTQLLLPFLLSIGYLYVISGERLSGAERFLFVRESHLKYSVSKTVSAMMSGGAIMLAGYLVFGLIVYAGFPAIQEYSAEQLGAYMEMNPGFSEGLFCIRRCIAAFLYGMCVNVFAYLAAIFFTDRYILLCLPLMLKYLLGQAVMKIEMNAMSQGKEKLLNICSGLRMENVMGINASAYWWGTLLILFGVYAGGLCLNIALLKKRGDGFGLE